LTPGRLMYANCQFGDDFLSYSLPLLRRQRATSLPSRARLSWRPRFKQHCRTSTERPHPSECRTDALPNRAKLSRGSVSCGVAEAAANQIHDTGSNRDRCGDEDRGTRTR
jgi:hypothetical protein